MVGLRITRFNDFFGRALRGCDSFRDHLVGARSRQVPLDHHVAEVFAKILDRRRVLCHLEGVHCAHPLPFSLATSALCRHAGVEMAFRTTPVANQDHLRHIHVGKDFLNLSADLGPLW